MRPTLLNSCAFAATAAQARFRIDAPLWTPRAMSVMALDPAAARVVERVAGMPWRAAHFLRCGPAAPDLDGGAADLALTARGGGQVWLSEELTEADLVVMIAASDDGAPAATTIGNACALRGIATAAVVLGERRDLADAISALRPYARVLLVTTDEGDVDELLSAVGT